MDNEKIQSIRSKQIPPLHYEGDIIKRLFLGAAFIMVATLPFFHNYFLGSPFISIAVIIILVGVAGFINHKNRKLFFIDSIISMVGLAVFESYAIHAYEMQSFLSGFFLVNQLLAIVFLFALYNSTKTYRSMTREEIGTQ